MVWNISYRLLGPTTVHLHHELYLLISLSLLEFASIRDIRFTALVTLWLSRSLWLRWLLTAHDTLTSLSETSLRMGKYTQRFQFNPIENTIDFLATTVFAGQTFDRPSSHVVAKFIGTNHMSAEMMVENDLGAVLNMNHNRNNGRRGANHNSGNSSGNSNNAFNHSHHHGNDNKSYFDILLDSALELSDAVLMKLREIAPSNFAMMSSEAYWTNLANYFGPSSQLLLPVCTLLFLYFCWIYPLSESGGGFVRYFTTIYLDGAQVLRDIYNIAANRNVIYYHYGRHDATPGPIVTNHALLMEILKDSGAAMGYSGEITVDNTKALGRYEQTVAPTWVDLVYYIIICGTCLAIILYGRVLLPIPDLVAGNMRKDGPSASSSGSSKGSHRNNNSHRGGGSHASSTVAAPSGDANVDQPWLEQYQSIVGEHRFKLIFKLAYIRLIENVFLIAILPQTNIACKITGQCPNKSGLLELAKVMFYAGIQTIERADAEDYQYGDGKHPFSVGDNPFRPDVPCAFIIGISVVVVTLSLLLAQATTLNRSHLGIAGYLAGGWIAEKDDENNNESFDKKHSPGSGSKSSNNTPKNSNYHHKSSSSRKGASSDPLSHHYRQPPEWVPRKRYKKGDRVTFEQKVYKATTNNPEGRPFEFFQHAAYQLFRNELGHPATSRLIAFVSTVQFGVIAYLISTILTYQILLDEHQQGENTTCLLWVLAGNIVAVYGTVSVAIPKYSEFDRLAQDIMKE